MLTDIVKDLTVGAATCTKAVAGLIIAIAVVKAAPQTVSLIGSRLNDWRRYKPVPPSWTATAVIR